MKSYPISVRREGYRGSNSRKKEKAAEYNRIAARVESYINDDLRDKPDDTIYQYLTHSIAREVGADYDLVHRAVFSIDCGSNGATIFKGNYEKAMAKVYGH